MPFFAIATLFLQSPPVHRPVWVARLILAFATTKLPRWDCRVGKHKIRRLPVVSTTATIPAHLPTRIDCRRPWRIARHGDLCHNTRPRGRCIGGIHPEHSTVLDAQALGLCPAIKVIPMDETSVVELPSVVPTASQESHCALGEYVQKDGFVPPISAPNGVGSW